MPRYLLIFVVALTSCVSTALAGTGEQTLWRVGTSDDSTAEFACAPADYRAYRQPGFFIIGQSDAKRDWPYVQPGSADSDWAPSAPRTFEIHFGLKAEPNGPCRLVLDLVDTHAFAPPKVSVAVNDNSNVWEFQTPPGAGDASVQGDPSKGLEHIIAVDIPAEALRAGNNRIAIATTSGSWLLWDAIWLEAPADVKLAPCTGNTFIHMAANSGVLLRKDGEAVQPITLEVRHTGKAVQATLRVGELAPIELSVEPGVQSIQVDAPPVDSARTVSAILQAGSETLAKTELALKPIRPWEICLIPQSHLDIGFTHTQPEVLKLQVQYLKTALDYIDRTKDYPAEAQFRWHPEGMWAVEEFMRTASDAEKERFIAACRSQHIHLDALYAQGMTGLYSEEELMELMGCSKRFEQQHGVSITSAMQSDVPGHTWGMASALAHHGVKYLSTAPNYGHRIGRVYEWADRPFYWVSPSGKDRILCWLPGRGYSWFQWGAIGQDGSGENRLQTRRGDILQYLSELEKKEYPYDMVQVRYSIGSDNGPPDPLLSDAVKSWNEEFVSPKMIISANSQMMAEFERRYADKIPIVAGDLTPYWEDGAASTANATAASRGAAERLAQSQILWSMLQPSMSLHERFDVAWHKLIMYDEHTWGAWNSITAPDDAFAVDQDRYKQAYAFDGAMLCDALLKDVTQAVAKERSETTDVYNTASWNRDGLVLLSPEQSAVGELVQDAAGNPVPSQRLASGELAFVAREVPAFGARRYSVHSGATHAVGTAKAAGTKLSNERLALEIDEHSGAIRSLHLRGIDADLVDANRPGGLNDYLYILGRDPDKNRAAPQGPVTITVEDAGPLVATLRIESDAPGCNSLVRRVRVVDGLGYVELTNTVDKLKERRPEGAYFSFPFNIPNAISRVDAPLAVVQVEKDQLPGANRNFYCVQRWVDLSSDDYGVTWVTLDAPMMQFDPIKIAVAQGLNWWRSSIDPGAHIYSWVMNNHWETNYKADQQGLVSFRYAVVPHAGGYNAVDAQRVGRAIHQPLVAVNVDPAKPVIEPLLQALPPGIVATSIRPSRDNEGTLIRLLNTADDPQQVQLKWQHDVGDCWLSNPMEERVRKAPSAVEMAKFEVVTLKVDQKNGE